MIISAYGCKEKKTITAQVAPGTAMLDSIRAAADTVYVKKYPRTDFATAEYFVSRKDSMLTQVMKDTAAVIRQIIITRNHTRIYFAQFYPNGQLGAKYKLGNFGQYNGAAEEYYENGALKRSGAYKGGFYSGSWKNFDTTGKLISTDIYDENGRQIESGKRQ